MNQTDDEFSTQNITPALISQIIEAIKNKAYGSVEIYIQNHTVTQITERTITKVANPNGQTRKPKDPSPYSSSLSTNARDKLRREVSLSASRHPELVGPQSEGRGPHGTVYSGSSISRSIGKFSTHSIKLRVDPEQVEGSTSSNNK